MKRISVLSVMLLAITACGKRDALRPAVGEALPPAPAMTTRPATPEELLTPTTQERPEREEELLRRSERRPDDRFNLPPPG